MHEPEPILGRGGAQLPRTHKTDNKYHIMLEDLVGSYISTEEYPFPRFTVAEFCKRYDIKWWEFYPYVYQCILNDKNFFVRFVDRYVANNGSYPPEPTYYFMLHFVKDKKTKLPFESNKGWRIGPDGTPQKTQKMFQVLAWNPKQYSDTKEIGRLAHIIAKKTKHAQNLRETLPIKSDIKEIAEKADELDLLLHDWEHSKLARKAEEWEE